MIDSYIPGVCNINKVDVLKRRYIGFVGISLGILLSIFIIVTDLDIYRRLIVFVPFFIGYLGLIQSRSKFCVQYAILGISSLPKQENNKKEKSNKLILNVSNSIKKEDLLKAVKIIFLSLILSILSTSVVLFI